MGKMTKKKWKIILSGMLCSLVFPLTVSAASMQDVAAMAAAVNGSGEMTAAHNCFLLESGGNQVLISAYNQQWELASAIQVASLTGDGEAAVTVNDSMAGVALMDFSGSMTACPEGAVASLMALSEGDTVIYQRSRGCSYLYGGAADRVHGSGRLHLRRAGGGFRRCFSGRPCIFLGGEAGGRPVLQGRNLTH